MSGPPKRKAADEGVGDSCIDSKRTKTDSGSRSDRSARVQSRISPFMELPQELRDMVYHELWNLTPSIRLPHLVLCYDGATDEDEGCLSGWLLTNKAILEQGLQQLHRSVIWNWRASHVRYVPSPATRSSSLIALTTATHFRIYLESTASAQSVHTPGLDIQDVLPKLGSDLKVLDLELHVYFSNRHVLALQGVPPWQVILPSFRTLDVQPEELNVRIEVYRGIHGNVLASEMLSALEPIIKQRGEKVLGQGPVVTSSMKERGSPVQASGPPRLVTFEFEVRRA